MLTKERIQAIRQENERIVKASQLNWIGRCFVKAMLELYILMWRSGFCLRANPFEQLSGIGMAMGGKRPG